MRPKKYNSLMVLTSVYLPMEVKEELQVLARERGVSLNEYVVDVLCEHLLSKPKSRRSRQRRFFRPESKAKPESSSISSSVQREAK